MTESLLRIDGLIVGPRGRLAPPILRGVDLEVARGSVVALVGESGSGKTTLVTSLLGIAAPALTVRAGALWFAGRALDGPRSRRGLLGRSLTYIAQDPAGALDPVLRIGTQFRELFRLHGDPLGLGPAWREHVIDLLDRVGVTHPRERLQQYPHELSGGLKQRIQIALAIALGPELIVADEPTSALDVTVQRRVMDTLQDLTERTGAALLLVTHDIGLAADRADRIAVMRDGIIVEDAETGRLVADPRSGYARRLLSRARTVAVGSARTDAPYDVARAAEIIVAEDVSKSYRVGRSGRRIQALDRVSFTVRTGSTVAIVGESGSGKSTLARTLSGMIGADSGTVRLQDMDVFALRGSARRRLWDRLQMVTQNPDASLNPRHRVEWIVAEPLVGLRRSATRVERRDRVRELLEQVGLDSAVTNRYPPELSGGQRQRVAIARALAARPDVVIFDEALSALDVITQDSILRLLDRLRAQYGLTYLFISHDLGVVHTFADEVVVMRDGRVEERGTTAEIFSSPQTAITRGLIDAIPGRQRLGRASSMTTTEEREATS